MQSNKKLYGLIGYPLSHSFSQKYFKNKFVKEKIFNCDYLNFEIENINQIPDLLKKHKNLKGFNVTIPYKIKILNYLDEIDKEAEAIGAINTVKIINKPSKLILKGYNTDVYGFSKSLKKYLKPTHKKALILGNGGAAKAVDYALKKLNIITTIVSRKTSKNQKTLNYNQITEKIINNNKILFDLIYNPSLTKFLLEAKKYSSQQINGEKMLKFQAEKSWKIFNL